MNMDPNETLRLLRNAVHIFQNADPDTACGELDRKYAAETMAEMFEALDGWICNGGYPPHWTLKR